MIPIVAVLALACTPVEPTRFEAEGGVLDLRTWDPSAGFAPRLEGEWRYFPRQLLEPGDTALGAEDTALQRLPGNWDERAYVPGHPEGSGFATYRLMVLLPPAAEGLGLRIRTLFTAHRLYVDGRLANLGGEVAKTGDSARPGYSSVVVPLEPADDDALELVLQISNYHRAEGGAYDPLWIGDAKILRSARENRISLVAFLAGSFSIIGLYHLILWVARRYDPSPLLFSCVCVAMALRSLTDTEIVLAEFVPSISWTNQIRIEYGSLLLVVGSMAAFLWTLFPRELPRFVARAFIGASLLGTGLVVLLPPLIFTRGRLLLQLFCLVAALIATVSVSVATARRREGAVLFLFGMAAITATGAHDVAITLHRPLIASPFFASLYLLPFGLVAFMLSQATLLARRQSRGMRALEDTSRDLERRVAERTAELEMVNRKLSHLAEQDGLTGVGNRRLFDRELSEAWRRHQQHRTPLSLLLIDVDHFKAYNDRQGHLAGDEALRQVATAIQEAVGSKRDLVARFGGEEFAVLLPDTALESARRMGDSIRRAVSGTGMPGDGPPETTHLTVSVGVASRVPGSSEEPSELTALADAALYRAKKAGRDRVETA